MPRATGGSAAEICEKTLAELTREADLELEKFMAAAEKGRHFGATMEKIEGQLSSVKKLEAAERDLELNEAQVIAEKLEGELAAAEKLATGAGLLECENEWAEQFESVRGSLELMQMHMRKMKPGGRGAMRDGASLEAKNTLLSFRREADRCRGWLSELHELFSVKGYPSHKRLNAAKKKLKSVRAGVGKAFSKITKGRLRKKIIEARLQIEQFFEGTHHAKMFVDHKHLTLQSGAHKVHLPLTQAVRFALEEIVPIESALSNLGKRGTVLTATYERSGKGDRMRVGERSVSGDAVIYREKSYPVKFGS